MLLDKENLVKLLVDTAEEIKGLDNTDYYFEMKLFAIDSKFAERASSLQRILETAAKNYVLKNKSKNG